MMNKAEEFLLKNGLHESCYDYSAHVEKLLAEMESGLANKKSSLRMLPSYIGITSIKPLRGEAIAIDAGGTNLRIALVRFSGDERPIIDKLEKRRLPGSENEINKDEFFSLLAEYIGDRTDISDSVGFCFSFPCDIREDREGRIIYFDKEVKVKGSEGVLIGTELNAAFARLGKPPVKVTVLNDTAAALIGAVVMKGIRDKGGYIGMIYGTGFNICYYDKIKSMLINTEMGGYNGFSKSVCDAEIDAESDDPGGQCSEKMISGAYIARIAMKAIRLAAAQGLFKTETERAILSAPQFDAADIDAFLKEEGTKETKLGKLCAGADDVFILKGILDGLYERAVKLAAISMTAVIKRSGASESHPAFIVAEGSAFKKGFLFQERFERRLNSYPGNKGAYDLELADDQVLIGAGASVFL